MGKTGLKTGLGAEYQKPLERGRNTNNMSRDYYKDLKRDDFESDETYRESTVEISLMAYHLLEAGYTLHECLEHCDGRLDCDTIERKSIGNRLHTGGDCGSDAYWQQQIKSRGFETVVYSFEGHQIKSNSRIILKEDTLRQADVHLKCANKTLKRLLPNINNYNGKFFRRNVFIVLNAEVLFAITYLRQNRAIGGTGWGVQLAIDMGKLVYVFDLGFNQWKEC